MGIPVQNPDGKVRIFQELCKGVEGCGICLHVCRKKLFKPALTLNRKGYRPPVIAEQESCTSCENCEIFCPDMAIAVSGRTGKRRVKT
jgi:2-oxoglutarate ferredoxin oxidoreductase subunit delta